MSPRSTRPPVPSPASPAGPSTDPTFTKLRSGAWGIRVPLASPLDIDRLFEGANVHVMTRAGRLSRVIVERVIWSDDTCAICAIVPRASASAPRARSSWTERSEAGDVPPTDSPAHYLSYPDSDF